MQLSQAAVGSAVRGAAEALTFDELHEAVFPRLLEVSGAHAALLYRFDERGVAGVAGNLRDEMARYSPEMFAGDPVQQALLAARDLPRLVVSTAMAQLDQRALKRSLAWADFYRPLELEHLLGMPLTPGKRYGEPGMAGILFASRAAAPFEADALHGLGEVSDALVAAHRRIERFEEERRQRQAVETVLSREVAAPHLALDLRARVLWISPRASELLGGAELPEALRGAAARLGALALGPTDSPVAARPRDLRFEVALPGPLRAVLSLARGPSGAPIVDVALDEPMPSALARIAERHALTPAETKTLSVLALGESNREIAARLGVSIETVRTHVKRVLGKLSVRTREEAARVARAA
jgi:DNA-binding CsgD family transcriptional regulator